MRGMRMLVGAAMMSLLASSGCCKWWCGHCERWCQPPVAQPVPVAPQCCQPVAPQCCQPVMPMCCQPVQPCCPPGTVAHSTPVTPVAMPTAVPTSPPPPPPVQTGQWQR